jgi:hypothetical protein
MTTRGRSQLGQAVIEALLMLPLMAVLLWAVSGIGALQFSAQRTTQVSRQAVMAAALGQPVASLRAPAGTELSGEVQKFPGAAVESGAALQDEWFGAAMSLLSVKVRSLPRGSKSVLDVPILRHISVASGAGYAHGDADGQHRVGASTTGWLQASQGSLAEAGRMQGYVDRVEAPWGRPSLSRDWLSPWADVVPNDRLGKHTEAGQ